MLRSIRGAARGSGRWRREELYAQYGQHKRVYLIHHCMQGVDHEHDTARGVNTRHTVGPMA